MKTFTIYWKNKRPTTLTNAVEKQLKEGRWEFLDSTGKIVAFYDASIITGVSDDDDGRSPEDDAGFGF